MECGTRPWGAAAQDRDVAGHVAHIGARSFASRIGAEARRLALVHLSAQPQTPVLWSFVA